MKAFLFFLYRSNDVYSRSEVLLAKNKSEAESKIQLIHNNWLLIPWATREEENRWLEKLTIDEANNRKRAQ